MPKSKRQLSTQAIVKLFGQAGHTKRLADQLRKDNQKLQVRHLAGSALSFFLTAVFKNLEKPFLFIANDKEEAAYYLNDLEKLMGEENVLFFPGSYRRPYQIEETDNANILLRSEVLNRINSRKKPAVIVSYPTALFEKVVTKSELNKNTIKLQVGENVSLDFINEALFEYKFKRVDFVAEPGDFSVRGGIVDVFSFANDQPYRIEFFGDEVESIRSFDIETQLSITQHKKVRILPNIEDKMLQPAGGTGREKRQSFLSYIDNGTVVFLKDFDRLYYRLNQLFLKAEKAFKEENTVLAPTDPEELYCNADHIRKNLASFSTVLANNTLQPAEGYQTFAYNALPQPSFNKQFDLLASHLKENNQAAITNYLCCANQQQAQRFHDIFDELDADIQYKTLVLPLYQGFIDKDLKIACYTDHQIFERYHKFRLKSGFSKKQALTLKELTNLEVGDYVTHIDHGIGKFGGLQKIEVEGKKQEAIKLIYGDRDVLYLSIHSLHKISKYNGKEGKPPKIYKLGSKAWAKLKQKTKTKVKEIAYDLIKLYAKRKMQTGYAFGPDTYMQLELESSFMYEDTPDQLKATQDVKADMESEQPMDRLVCGDVGFGKTEVAIRAAFKAVDNGKQVAVLVPTTILAFQHFQTFKERLAEFPVVVDYLNRFRTTKDRNRIKKELANGKIDIVIGTHQLVNKTIRFKDLGLLVVDEEQKFGVAVKDKLKTIKANVDTLTLTATPIPRTLQFSLMAARDLSVITTPPPNRHPIDTRVIRFNEETIRDAVQYEISRGGQVFFIHNRIENIREVAGLLQRLLPNANIGIGHGRMEGKKLEQLMLSFINNEFDVLVSTTIVESGLDVPNANTIFINNANSFGLSDLHQMRGRVGRSNKKAFCYFITPPYHMITDDARKRIQALEVFTELGSGLQIAMKDLEIRGAGDLLGGEQSGFINDIGFETYQKILNEAIAELKENEFRELYKGDGTEPETYVKDLQLDTDFELLFPDDYINSITERLNQYKALGELNTEEELESFKEALEDRFGELPPPAEDLLNSVRVKWVATKIGFERLILKKGKMVGYFISDKQSPYYQSPVFTKVLQYVQTHAQSCTMKEKETKNGKRLLLTFKDVGDIDRALTLLKGLLSGS